jgi:hypothetical protein
MNQHPQNPLLLNNEISLEKMFGKTNVLKEFDGQETLERYVLRANVG